MEGRVFCKGRGRPGGLPVSMLFRSSLPTLLFRGEAPMTATDAGEKMASRPSADCLREAACMTAEALQVAAGDPVSFR